ncbi:MAG: hypothetical protein L0177_18845 [Chloroflexi bacterium]|nr:hypothetical protein [Chloroflexota bacterium]
MSNQAFALGSMEGRYWNQGSVSEAMSASGATMPAEDMETPDAAHAEDCYATVRLGVTVGGSVKEFLSFAQLLQRNRRFRVLRIGGSKDGADVWLKPTETLPLAELKAELEAISDDGRALATIDGMGEKFGDRFIALRINPVFAQQAALPGKSASRYRLNASSFAAWKSSHIRV